jgi:hypothetical protein
MEQAQFKAVPKDVDDLEGKSKHFFSLLFLGKQDGGSGLISI